MTTTGSGIDLGGEIADQINSALANGRPIAVTYVDAAGRPRISLRGSTHVHSKDQIALWIRRREGLAEAIGANPNVALLFRDSSKRTTIICSGRAHEDVDPAVRARVFSESPEPERDHDPEQHGIAVLVDVDDLSSITVGDSPIRMTRG